MKRFIGAAVLVAATGGLGGCLTALHAARLIVDAPNHDHPHPV